MDITLLQLFQVVGTILILFLTVTLIIRMKEKASERYSGYNYDTSDENEDVSFNSKPSLNTAVPTGKQILNKAAVTRRQKKTKA
jgi:hypothetical protein